MIHFPLWSNLIFVIFFYFLYNCFGYIFLGFNWFISKSDWMLKLFPRITANCIISMLYNHFTTIVNMNLRVRNQLSVMRESSMSCSCIRASTEGKQVAIKPRRTIWSAWQFKIDIWNIHFLSLFHMVYLNAYETWWVVWGREKFLYDCRRHPESILFLH